MENISILVVEDDMIIAADISMHLTEMGYEVTAIVPRGDMALKSIETERPDLVLMDINLKGDIDGIETAQRMEEKYQIPLIFLTANSDKATFDRAKVVQPHAFIVKPFNPDNLQRSIELAISKMEKGETKIAPEKEVEREEDAAFVLEDRIFVRHKDRMIKLYLKDILYIKAESNYCAIHIPGKKYLLAITLKAFEKKLLDQQFLRVHRSYIVNLSKLEEVGELYLKIGNEQIPISKSNREALFQRLKMF